MESIKMRSLSGVCKAVGVTVCLAGVVTIALYRGPHIHPFNLLPHHGHSASNQDQALAHSKATWIKGSFFMIIANLTWSLWLVLQVSMTHIALFKDSNLGVFDTSPHLFDRGLCWRSTPPSYFSPLSRVSSAPFSLSLLQWHLRGIAQSGSCIWTWAYLLFSIV